MKVVKLLENLEFEEFAAWNVEDFIRRRNIDQVEDAIEMFIMNYNDEYDANITTEDVKEALREYYERYLK